MQEGSVVAYVSQSRTYEGIKIFFEFRFEELRGSLILTIYHRSQITEFCCKFSAGLRALPEIYIW